MNGIILDLEEYCDYCPDFEPSVNKLDITSCGDSERRVQSSIRCECADRYSKIYRKARQVVKNEK